MIIPDKAVLILSGGNALGAYHAGAYEMLVERGIEPQFVVGTSIGAIVGAIIAGNPPQYRLEKLRAFWAKAAQPNGIAGQVYTVWPRWVKWAAGLQALLSGRPGLFQPHLFDMFAGLSDEGGKASVLDTSPTNSTLAELIDFDRLNAGDLPLTIVAVDAETGEEVVFDTRRDVIGPDHLRASASMPVLFEPVRIDGRWLVDGGMSSNLPLIQAFSQPIPGDVLYIALDLLPGRGARARSIGDAVMRAQDLIFACQSRHALGYLQLVHELRRRRKPDGSSQEGTTTIVHLSYGGSPDETAIKALDFAEASLHRRWEAGKRDIIAALDSLVSQPEERAGPFAAFRLHDRELVSASNWL